MAQLNPNFEIDFSDINSYEQIQLMNDTQLAKENLLMHRAYQEPSDDEIIRNHFSSFTFVDFCPRLFTIKQPSRLIASSPCPGSRGINNPTIGHHSNDPPSSSASSSVKYYELETFSDLFERINKWLKLNKDWRVVSMETLVFDCISHFNYLKSSIHSTYLPQNTRGLRLFLSPSKSRFSGPQKIGCINVVPRKLSGSHTDPDAGPIVYETLSDILSRLNELLLSRPIEGRILSVETITLPMSNGFVNTESNYFMDSRINLLYQSTYNIGGCCGGDTFSNLSQHPTSVGSLSSPTSAFPPNNDPTRNGHYLIDILRVYYEFGPMAGGLVNLIDFIPRFYSPTPTSKVTSSNSSTEHESQPRDDESQQQQVPKEAATESLTRLIRRSLAWFETERKRILVETKSDATSGYQTSAATSATDDKTLVNLKVCNLQVHHKTLLKHQLINVNPSNVIESLNTRSMLHEPIRFRSPISCHLCNLSTGSTDPQVWCSHLLEQTQIYQLKFVRLAYVVPVNNKYAKFIYPIRSVRIKPHTKSTSLSSKQLHDTCRMADDFVTSSSSTSSDKSTSSSSSASPSPSLSCSPSSSSFGSQNQPSASSKSRSVAPEDEPGPNSARSGAPVEQNEANESRRDSDDDINTAIVKEVLNSNQQQEWMKQAALAIVSATNERHRQDEEAHQLAGRDSSLNDAPIGQLTYRLFAPCQLVKSSSCFSINPVNSSSPLSRRGSLDLNGSGISSEDAHPAGSLLTSVGQSQTNLVEQSASSSPFFPHLSTSDFLAAATGPLTDGSIFGVGTGSSSKANQGHEANQSNSKYFASNEFELVDAIKRRMEIYVTTNSMKVIAGETLIINLSDSLSCLSTAIEQTVIKAPTIRSRPSTWVCVYILYAAVDEPHLPSKLLAYQQQQQQQIQHSRHLELIDEERGNEDEDSAGAQDQEDNELLERADKDDIGEPHFDDDFKCDMADKSIEAEQVNDQQELVSKEQEDDTIVDCHLAANIYNSAYDRTVALPTSPESPDTINRPIGQCEPIEVLGSQVTNYLWLDEADLADVQHETFRHLDRRRSRASTSASRRRSKASKKLHNHDSQCLLI